jgi:hypothetical protein
MGAVQEGMLTGPTGTHVGTGQSLAELAGSVRSAGGHPVKLEETGLSLVLIEHDLYRYLVPQEIPRLSQAQAPQPPLVFYRFGWCAKYIAICQVLK